LKAAQLIVFFILPYLFKKGEERFKWMSFFGTVVWCYLFGIILGNSASSLIDTKLTNTLIEVSVLLAVPLLLFTLDIKAWLKNTRSTIISFIISLVSISLATLSVSLAFTKSNLEVWKLGGMLVGVYSGGTVNMSAIGKSLEVPNETFLMVNAADILISSVYMLIVLMGAKKILSKFLPPYQFLDKSEEETDQSESFRFKSAGLAITLALIVVAISLGLSTFFYGEFFAPFILLVCTSLGILFSLNKSVQTNPSSFKTGEYILYIFCIALGSLCNFNNLSTNAPEIVLFVSLVLVIAISLHFIGARFFKIDADTALITNVAAVFGPAFVAPVARSLGNKQIIVSGLTSGLMGYAFGNYLGLAMAHLIKAVI
jgi:uncharacterized membrane protein